MASLGGSLRPCGPVLDLPGAARTLEILAPIARAEEWSAELTEAWPALAPAFAASPYLSALSRQSPERLARILRRNPEERLGEILRATQTAAKIGDTPRAESRLRALKSELHLLAALADLGGIWDLDAVTRALSRFADAALNTAVHIAAAEESAAGRLTTGGAASNGPIPGLFCIALGKHGAFELNYSSDIDISIFYDTEYLPLTKGVEPGRFAVRFAERITSILQRRTTDGYVFRVDLRLRPDPSSTPIAVPVAAAHLYYESVGQNWERAAFIKARVVAGDISRGQAFLDSLVPFIWRRNLDFAAIADIQSIRRQIHAHGADDYRSAKGVDLKLGVGGIREIEFFVQTQQLILGGRHQALRSSRTLDALNALAHARVISRNDASKLTLAYKALRTWEHRVQMVGDEQTHRLPPVDAERTRVAILAGFDNLGRFDAAVARTMKTVNRLCGRLFTSEETLSSCFGSLVFTGVEDDPETVTTLTRMGFENPTQISATIRAWHHGRIAATRTERGRELLTRLAPRLLEATQATGAADAAFARFADFFGGLTTGVQVQSLFLAQPKLLELVVRVMAFAPRFAQTLARRPAALDALLDRSFFGPITQPLEPGALDNARRDFEASMNAARRLHRECTFRIGVQVLAGAATAKDAGLAFANLADALVAALSRAALDEVERKAGRFDGDVAVIALGKCGSREMTARSDLDLMTLYRARSPNDASTISGLGAETFYARFTQRLVAALSAPTAEGVLYDVDLQLRPSGTKGPVAVSSAAFENYYRGEAEVWELLALTRARVVWASSPAFATTTASALEGAIRRPRDRRATAADVREMRALVARERPATGFWDMKLSDGGLVDIEFAAQFLQLIGAAEGGPLRQNTGEALGALADAGLAPRRILTNLWRAWDLQQNLSQLLKVALEEDADPDGEPSAFRDLLARAGQASNFNGLRSKLERAREMAHATFLRLID